MIASFGRACALVCAPTFTRMHRAPIRGAGAARGGGGRGGGGGAGTSHGTKTHRQRIEHFLHVIVCSREARLTREQRMQFLAIGRTDNHVRAHLLDEGRVGRACATVGLQPD